MGMERFWTCGNESFSGQCAQDRMSNTQDHSQVRSAGNIIVSHWLKSLPCVNYSLSTRRGQHYAYMSLPRPQNEVWCYMVMHMLFPRMRAEKELKFNFLFKEISTLVWSVEWLYMSCRELIRQKASKTTTKTPKIPPYPNLVDFNHSGQQFGTS
jgi:hypothetical protein